MTDELCIWTLIATHWGVNIFSSEGNAVAMPAPVAAWSPGKTSLGLENSPSIRLDESTAAYITEFLRYGADRGDYDELVLIAPGHLLQLLRERMTKSVKSRLLTEIDTGNKHRASDESSALTAGIVFH